MRGGDSVTHQLTKKLQHLKKKIKQFEEQFEKERNYKVKTEMWSCFIWHGHNSNICEALSVYRKMLIYTRQKELV